MRRTRTLVAPLVAVLALVGASCAANDEEEVAAGPTTSAAAASIPVPIDAPALACEPEFLGMGNDAVFPAGSPDDLGDAMVVMTAQHLWPNLAAGAAALAAPDHLVESTDDRVQYAQSGDKFWVALDGDWVAYETLAWLEESETQGWGGGAGPGWGYPGGGVQSTECPTWSKFLDDRKATQEDGSLPRPLSCGEGRSDGPRTDLESAKHPEPDLGKAIDALLRFEQAWPPLLDPAAATPGVELASVDDRVTYEQADGYLWVRLDDELMIAKTLAWIDRDEPSSIEPGRSGWGAPDARAEHRECPDWRLFEVHRRMGEGGEDDLQQFEG